MQLFQDPSGTGQIFRSLVILHQLFDDRRINPRLLAFLALFFSLLLLGHFHLLSQIVTYTQNFPTPSADVMLGSFAQYYVQPSAAPINPSVNVSGCSDAFNSIAVALKSATQGTPPLAGIRIVHVYPVMVNKTTPMIFPSVGNLLLIATARPESEINYTSVSSNPGTLGRRLMSH